MARLALMAPALLLLGAVLGVPLAVTVAGGLGQWGAVLADAQFRQAAATTLAFATVSVTLELVLGVLFALALDAAWRLRGTLRAIALLPWALPSAVMALSWRWIFHDTHGVANALLVQIGLIDEPLAWLGRPGLAFAALVVADVWKTTPFVTIIVLAGLQAIPRDLHEALSLDGAGPVRRFRLLTLPLLRPAIGLVLTFRLIQAAGIFDIVWVMTGGGPADSTRTVALYVYDVVFRYLRPEYGAAVTTVVAAGLLAVAAGVAAATRSRVPERAS